MPLQENKEVYTIGHSTRTLEHFVEMLQSFHIQLLIDIRNYPGSKRYPHFNKEHLEQTLPQHNIEYIHLKYLGGRRAAQKDSKNTGWKNEAFRGYADYMETGEFKAAIDQLQNMALEKRTAHMCSEAVWWRCHRSLVSDYLKLHGWKVHHIMEVGKATDHTYTQPAKIINGKLTYGEDTLF